MKYYFDTEFHEYKKKVLPWSKGINTIDLISIGIVTEDLDEPANERGTLIERSYYAISKDFDLRDAWNSYQMKQVDGDLRNRYPDGMKEYWLRDNVLKPIFDELNAIHNKTALGIRKVFFFKFSYWSLRLLLHWYGKSNAQIAEEIIDFVEAPSTCKVKYEHEESIIGSLVIPLDKLNIEFYAYYADYDWVVFCWLFGKMINLPKGFPMYCKDLKQNLDEWISEINKEAQLSSPGCPLITPKSVKDNNSNYPKQTKEHDALADAKWNKELHKFISNL